MLPKCLSPSANNLIDLKPLSFEDGQELLNSELKEYEDDDEKNVKLLHILNFNPVLDMGKVTWKPWRPLDYPLFMLRDLATKMIFQ